MDREWTGLEFGRSQRTVENREKMQKTGCEIICGARTTLADDDDDDDDDDIIVQWIFTGNF